MSCCLHYLGDTFLLGEMMSFRRTSTPINDITDVWKRSEKKIFSSLNVLQLLLFHRFPLRDGVLVNCCGGVKKKKRTSERWLGLRVDPGMIEAFGGRGPLLRHHLQHGQEEVGEVAGVFVWPAVLLHQHVKQGPGLELGDVPQLAWRGRQRRESTTGQRLVQERVSSLKIRVVLIFHSTNSAITETEVLIISLS